MQAETETRWIVLGTDGRHACGPILLPRQCQIGSAAHYGHTQALINLSEVKASTLNQIS